MADPTIQPKPPNLGQPPILTQPKQDKPPQLTVTENLLTTPEQKTEIAQAGSNTEFTDIAKSYLKKALNYVLIPVSLVSAVSSLSNFYLVNVKKGENSFLDKVASISNRLAYFLNGIFGATSNALDKNLPGAVGYGTVALASIIGTEENLYQLKGFGSALDQLPSMIQDAAHNPRIKELYNIEEGEEKKFNKYSSLWNSVEKTFVACKVVCGDVVRELFTEKKSPMEVFGFKNKRSAERNLVLSSIGIFTGSFLGMVAGFPKLGSSIRDVFGGYADLALFNKIFSYDEHGKPTGSNMGYGVCGAMYGIASLVDLVYRWTGIEKVDQAAIGLDNAGFLAMNWANLKDIEKNQEFNEENNGVSQITIQEPQVQLATP